MLCCYVTRSKYDIGLRMVVPLHYFNRLIFSVLLAFFPCASVLFVPFIDVDLYGIIRRFGLRHESMVLPIFRLLSITHTLCLRSAWIEFRPFVFGFPRHLVDVYLIVRKRNPFFLSPGRRSLRRSTSPSVRVHHVAWRPHPPCTNPHVSYI